MNTSPDNFLGLPPELCDPATAKFAIIPVPYEATVSYGGGTVAGPRAIISASQQVELFNGRCEPADAGVTTLSEVPVTGVAPEIMIELVAAAVTANLAADRVPIIIGGEHTVTLGAVKALLDRDGNNFGVVQIDAHCDLRDSYQGTQYSHACVMRRIAEHNIPILQIGVRSLCREEQAYRDSNARISYVDASDIAIKGLPARLVPANFPRRIYLTIDIDGLDPSVVPGTGTPEPGGLDWYTAIEVVRRVAAFGDIIGFDMVEVAPIAGSHVSEFVAAKLIYITIDEILQSREQ